MHFYSTAFCVSLEIPCVSKQISRGSQIDRKMLQIQGYGWKSGFSLVDTINTSSVNLGSVPSFFGECVKPSKHGFVPLFIEEPAVTTYQCGCWINIVTLQKVKIFISNFVQALPGIGD